MNTEAESNPPNPTPAESAAPRGAQGVQGGPPRSRSFSPGRRPGGGGGGGNWRRGRGSSRDARPRKVCKFCVDREAKIDYKDINLLRGFISIRGKIWPGRTSGLCASHQRIMGNALKRARIMALLPFTASQ